MEDEEAWLKGPFVQVGLPFSGGKAGRHFFQTFQTAYPGYIHQELAWERLCSNRKAQSTLVATGTGTGSGKTECFLFPVLDHCSRARAAGDAGIKALVIYPMNAHSIEVVTTFQQKLCSCRPKRARQNKLHRPRT